MKKNLLLLTLIFFISFTVHAQINKGSVFLGGSLSYSHTSFDLRPLLSLRPQIGISNKENSVLGIILNYADSKPYSNYNYRSYGGGFFFRRYKPLGKNFYLFGQGQLTGIYSKQTTINSTDETQTTKQYIYSLGFFPGLSYGITRKFYVEASLNNLILINYNRQITENSNVNGVFKGTENTFIFSTYSSSNLPLSLGFHFLL